MKTTAVTAAILAGVTNSVGKISSNQDSPDDTKSRVVLAKTEDNSPTDDNSSFVRTSRRSRVPLSFVIPSRARNRKPPSKSVDIVGAKAGAAGAELELQLDLELDLELLKILKDRKFLIMIL